MTASTLRLASLGLLSVLAATGARSAAVDRTIFVDCDHGGDLHAALRRAGPGPAQIRVIGTCAGQFETAGDKIEIIGRSPAETRIGMIGGGPSGAGPSGPALRVTGPGLLTVRNVAMFNSPYGLYVEGPGRTVLVENCEITGNAYGVFALHAPRVVLQNTQVVSNAYSGIAAYSGTELGVLGGSIRDNLQGISLFDRSTLYMSDNEIRGNQTLGLYAQGLCTITATRTTLLDNGSHVAVLDRSALTVVDSTVEPPGTAGFYSFYTDGDSRTTLVSQFSPMIVHGTAHVGGGSNLVVLGATLHDRVEVQEFSWVKLTDAAAEGTISCQAGSDAICAGTASALVSGCGPASSSCAGTPAPASEAPAFLKLVPEGGMNPPPR